MLLRYLLLIVEYSSCVRVEKRRGRKREARKLVESGAAKILKSPAKSSTFRWLRPDSDSASTYDFKCGEPSSVAALFRFVVKKLRKLLAKQRHVS